MSLEIDELYGNRVRVRVSGLLVQDDRLLMVNHRSLADGDFWAPPGGGINFGESATTCLEREFLEETGLEVSASDFLYGCEFISPPLHAVELIFRVTLKGGSLSQGTDPEMNPNAQIIQEVKFLKWVDIQKLPPSQVHGIFRQLRDPQDVIKLKGYHTI